MSHSPVVGALSSEIVASPRVWELASGVDTLYLSGHAELPAGLVARLEEAKKRARLGGGPGLLSKILSRGSTRLVVVGLAVLAVARFVPLGVVQFYVQPAAGIVALWPLAYTMWQTTSREGSGVVQAGA